MSQFPERLKYLRKENLLTQKEIANLLNIQRVTYSHYETGRSQPSIDTLILLSNIFDCSIDYLVGISDNKKKV
ncbi:transcriptional regulator [Bacillus phage G]|uniref:Gp62 n=1 Tax=Bacillus phage G TaxID=2884420 RepID=G3MBD2_9CAUD|nr:transcriptional regulator [Bacillus phage G]AEO93333.1 gp62 [Bacillus phage G]